MYIILAISAIKVIRNPLGPFTHAFGMAGQYSEKFPKNKIK